MSKAPTKPRRPPTESVRRLVLDVLDTEGRPMAVLEVFHATGLDGPSQRAVADALRALAAGGEVTREKDGGRPATYRTGAATAGSRDAPRHRVLGLLSRTGRPWSVNDIVNAFDLDGPGERAVRKAIRELIASGDVAASGEQVRPETFRVVVKGEGG